MPPRLTILLQFCRPPCHLPFRLDKYPRTSLRPDPCRCAHLRGVRPAARAAHAALSTATSATGSRAQKRSDFL